MNSVVVVASGDTFPEYRQDSVIEAGSKEGRWGTRLEPHDIALAALESVLDFCLVEAETSPVVTLVRALALQPLPSFCQSFWGAEAVVRFARLQGRGVVRSKVRPGFRSGDRCVDTRWPEAAGFLQRGNRTHLDQRLEVAVVDLFPLGLEVRFFVAALLGTCSVARGSSISSHPAASCRWARR